MKHVSYLMLGILSYFTFFSVKAQDKFFDPLLDPECKASFPELMETWNSTYMWYPGLLSAHKQKIQKEKSDNRCVNVDYPGNFMKDYNRTIFRKKIKLAEDTEIRWNDVGKVSFSVDDREINNNLKVYKLSSGTHFLKFDVMTENRLPALIVQGEGIQDLEGWQVSLDNQSWNLPETDIRYNKPSIAPDDSEELTVTILPDKYIVLRNTVCRDSLLELGENARVLLDFNHLEIGNVIVRASGSGTISFSVGESPDEALNEDIRGFEQRDIEPFVLTDSIQEFILPERALRYLKIACDRPCKIKSVRFDAKIWPVKFLMQFECSSQSLNNIWKAGVATLHASMHNFYLDGIKRDFLPWSMDAIISSLGGDYVFGDRQVSRNGISVSLMPLHPQISDWGIVDYPLHALIGLKHDYMRYGDLVTSLMFKERILQQLALYESIQDENGFIEADRPSWGFIPGWARKMGPEEYGKPAYAQMMLYQNFLIGSYFARLWNDDSLAKHYVQKAEQLKNSIINYFWDNEKKAFINGYRINGEKDYRISHHAQYWGILTGLYPEENYNYLFDKIIPAIPFYKEEISYEKGYEFLAYIKAGRKKEIFTMLDEVWGDWLRQGNTRFPENFTPHISLKEQLAFYNRPFGLSLCHGTNGVPPIIAVLYGLYGFSQSDKNLSEYTLCPDLMSLDWIKGCIPIKEGNINIHLIKEGVCSIEIPKNCTVHLYPNGRDGKLLTYKKAGVYTFRMK